jgi:hypothetical protein
MIAIGLFGAGTWAPAVATAAAGLLMAFAYVRAVAACTGARARFAIPGYLPAVLVVIALAVAPAHLRVITSLATGLVSAPVSLLLAARWGAFDPALIRKSLGRRFRERGYTAARG